MKRRIILNVLVVVLTISVVFEFYVYFNNSKVLEDIKTIDVFNKNDKSLAIMIQNEGENDFGWHEAEDRSKWPDKTKYTYAGAECTDSEGVSVPSKNILSFDETSYTAHIKTKQTIYCTLYFGKGRHALETLDAQGGDYYGGGTQGSRVAVEGLYRFKGTKDQVTNNFICIGGPKNPETCGSAENNKYLYRIIGVTDGTEKDTLGLEAGMLKVIKVIPSSTSQAWATDNRTNIDWDNGSNIVRTTLNGTFYNSLETGIKNIIPAVKWWKGNRQNATSSGAETKTATTGQYQIGLMYAGDYYNSWTYVSSPYSTNSWLHITNTMSGKTSTYSRTYEWTMTRYGKYENGDYYAWFVDAVGILGRNYVAWTSPSVRPVFYLPSITGLVGNGTESSPYVITSLSNA